MAQPRNRAGRVDPVPVATVEEMAREVEMGEEMEKGMAMGMAMVEVKRASPSSRPSA